MVDRGLHRERVGVVGVVQQQAAPGQLLEPAAQGRELDAACPRLCFLEAVADGDEGADGGQGVLQVMAAAEAEVERRPASEGVDQGVRLEAAHLGLGHADVGALAAEGDEAAGVIAQMGLEQGLVGGRDESALAQLGDDLGLGGGDLFDRADELEVDRGDVGDDGDVGLDDGGELGDLTATPHGKLADEYLGGRLEGEHGERHADLVVMVAARGHDARHGRQQGREDVLGRGLADAAGDGHDRRSGAAAHRGREAAQRALGVVDHDARRAGPHGRRRPLLDDDGHRAGAERDAGEVAAVERWAAQRHEQVAGRRRPAVDGDAGRDGSRVAGLQAAAAGGRHLIERQGDHAPPSASPASPASRASRASPASPASPHGPPAADA